MEKRRGKGEALEGRRGKGKGGRERGGRGQSSVSQSCVSCYLSDPPCLLRAHWHPLPSSASCVTLQHHGNTRLRLF